MILYCKQHPEMAADVATRWQTLLPEVAALGAYLVGAFTPGWMVILLPSLIRAALMLAIAVHGLGHALAIGTGVRTRLTHYLAGAPLRGLLPFAPLFLPGLGHPSQAPAMAIEGHSSTPRRWIALAGPGANLAALIGLSPWLATLLMTTGAPPFTLIDWALTLFAICNLWIMATSWSDYATLISGTGQTVFCGNFGIIGKRDRREHGFLPKRFAQLVERLGQETDVRGQQAGGIAILTAGQRFVGRKVVNHKRSDLTRTLLKAFRRQIVWRRLTGERPLRKLFHLVAHYRYGTSSEPSVVETHWHRWLPARRQRVWVLEGQTLTQQRQVVETLITHNGDFMACSVAGARRSYSELGVWLGQVLGSDHPAQGDSPKIAGMMDLLLTQGRWNASLRLAYAMQTGQALPQRALNGLAEVFDQVFARWCGGALGSAPNTVGCDSLAQVEQSNPAAVQALVDALQQATLGVTRNWPEEAKQARQTIVTEAVRAFFRHDLLQATRQFMTQAEGTFGLVVTSSLGPGSIVLATERQPLFVATDPHTGILLYASEAAALKSAWEQGGDGEPTAEIYRYDLSDGDLMLLRVFEDTADNSMSLVKRGSDAAPITERITPEALASSAREADQGGWIALRDNPCVEPATVAASRRGKTLPDRVLTELRDIPPVLDRVQREWDDPSSLNRRTASAFSQALFHNACHGPTCDRKPGGPHLSAILDLLVLGVENSAALGRRFADDIKRVFPLLHVAALDAVAYCEDPQRYAVGPSTITLAISQSGQTFNSLDAVKFLQQLHGLDKAGPVFVMTGEIDTLMGAAVGQRLKAGAPWGARIFATGAGWRTAEPATVSVAAAQATLTELLLRLMRDARAVCSGNSLPFGLATSDADLAKLDALVKLTVSRSAALLGRTPEGWQVETAESIALQRQGRYLSRLLIEPALIFIVTAIHLFVMLWLGWNPVIGLEQLLHTATGWPAFDRATTVGNLLAVVGQTAYFLFAGVAFTLLLRWLQRRPLWDRVFVSRTLVIGEVSYVKDLLAQYVSKLFSLAYEFAGFAGVHAADIRTGELLHGYGHRITRGLLLYLGLPDGRWDGRERAEAAARMTSNQARGVRNMGAGATVLGIGHNPASAAEVDRFVLLGLSGRTQENLPWVLRGDWSALAKDLQESRFASFERLLAGYVIFYTAAARTRDVVNRLVPVANLLWMPIFWTVRILTLGRIRPRFGRWDIARTQSGTRIATTAAPVPAISLDPQAYQPPTLRHGAISPARLQPDPHSVVPLPLASAGLDAQTLSACSRRYFQANDSARL